MATSPLPGDTRLAMSQESVDLVARLARFPTLRARVCAGGFVWDLSPLRLGPTPCSTSGQREFNEFIAKWTEAYDEFEQRPGTV